MHSAWSPLRRRGHKGAHCPRCKIRAETISQCLSACPPHSMHVPICLCVCTTIAAQTRQRDSSLFTRHCSWCLASGPCHDPWHCHWLISGAHCAPGQHPLPPITPPTSLPNPRSPSFCISLSRTVHERMSCFACFLLWQRCVCDPQTYSTGQIFFFVYLFWQDFLGLLHTMLCVEGKLSYYVEILGDSVLRRL